MTEEKTIALPIEELVLTALEGDAVRFQDGEIDLSIEFTETPAEAREVINEAEPIRRRLE